MKAILASLLAAMFAFAAIQASAAPIGATQASTPSDQDKDKDKDEKKSD